jgi:hypothetical protein
MRKPEELEFSFWGAKGRATGRFPIVVLALLILAAIAVIAFLPSKFGWICSAITWMARIRGP